MAINFTPDDVASGFNLSKLNSNFDKVDTALQDALSRSGQGPNQMEADIDLNSNDLLNVNQTKTNELFINGSLVTPDALQTIPSSIMLKSVYDPTLKLIPPMYPDNYDPQGLIRDVFDRKNWGEFDTKASAIASTIPASITLLHLNGDVSKDDGLGGNFTNTNNGSDDTFTSNGGTRTWYRARDVSRKRLSNEFLDSVAQIDNIPNYDPTASATRLIINGNTENGGSPIYHRHFGTIEQDNIGRTHIYYRRALGHATYFEGGIYGVYLEHNGQQRSGEFEVVAPVTGFDLADPRLKRLPNGDMLLLWQELPITSPGVVGTPVVFKAKVSKDNGNTWGPAYTVFSAPFSYARLFGQIMLLQDYGVGGRWRLAFTAYYRVSLSPDVLHTAIFYSEDEGKTWAEGTPIFSGTTQYNETAVAFINASVGCAIMRVNPADGFWISRTFDGGTTWSAAAKLTAIEVQAVAPSLDVITKDGVQYFLLGYCDRTADTTKFRWDTAKKVMSVNTAFSGNSKITSAADMIEASGYQATKIFPSGQMLYAEFKEYTYNTTIADPVGTDVRLVFQNIGGLISGEESFTPTIVGATTPGTATGTFTGTIKKDADGLVTGMLRIALTSKGGMVGQLKIGLPYTNRTGTRYRSGGSVNFYSGVTIPNYGNPVAFMASASATLDLWASTATGTDTTGLANLTAAQVSDTFVIEISFQYFTDD